MADISQYLTITEAAELRGISRQAVLEYTKSGTLKATKIGNQWLIERKDIEEFVPPPEKPRRARKGEVEPERAPEYYLVNSSGEYLQSPHLNQPGSKKPLVFTKNHGARTRTLSKAVALHFLQAMKDSGRGADLNLASCEVILAADEDDW